MLRLALNFARSLEPPLCQRLSTSPVLGNDESKHALHFWAKAGIKGDDDWGSVEEEEEVIPAVFQILMETGTRDLPSQEFGTALNEAFNTQSVCAVECLLNEPKTFEAIDDYAILAVATAQLKNILPDLARTNARYMRWLRMYRRCVDRALAKGDVTWNYEPPIVSAMESESDRSASEHLLIQCARSGLSDMVHALLQHLPMIDVGVRSTRNDQTALQIAESRIDNNDDDSRDREQTYQCLYAAAKWMEGYHRDVTDLLHSWNGLSQIPTTLLTLIGTYVAGAAPELNSSSAPQPTSKQ